MSTVTPALPRRQTARSVLSSTSERQPPPPKSSKPVTLAGRLLFPNLPPDVDLPPLLVSPSATPELNKELYDFIAIALRAYIHPWWTKITRYDKEFLPAITRVLTAVIRTFEARIVKTDLSPLLLHDLPTLLAQHYADYRSAQAKLHTSYAAGGSATLPQLFHNLQPHMALSAEGKVDEAYIRQALDDVLKACLPEEDYEPESERYIIREILVKVILHSIIPKVTQPWFIHQTVLNLVGREPDAEQRSEVVGFASEVVDPSTRMDRPSLRHQHSHTFTFQSLAILFFSTVQSISGACLVLIHAYKNALGAIRKVNQSGLFPQNTSPPGDKGEARPTDTIPGSLIPLSPIPPSTFMIPSSPSPAPPSPPPQGISREPSIISGVSSSGPGTPESTFSSPSPTPVHHPLQRDYVQPPLHLLNAVLAPSPADPSRSMPCALTHILTLCLTPFSGLLSRLLPSLLYTHVLSANTLVSIVRSAKGALFPGGWPAVPPPDPTLEEQVQLRREAKARLIGRTPGPLLFLFGSNEHARSQAMNGILDPLSSQECNAHLLMLILDLILVTVFPEMGVSEGDHPADFESLRTPAGSFNSLNSFRGESTPRRQDIKPL